MERFSRFPAESGSNDSSESKTTPKKRDGLRVPGLAKVEAGEGATGQHAQAFHEAMNMQRERSGEQEVEKKTKKRKKKKSIFVPQLEETASDTATEAEVPTAEEVDPKDDEQTDVERGDAEADYKENKATTSETYEPLPNQELPAHALSGGEVVIDLAALRREQAQAAEYELPLRDEKTEPMAESEANSSEQSEQEDYTHPSAETTRPVQVEEYAQPPVADPELPATATAGGSEPPIVPPESYPGPSADFPEPEHPSASMSMPPPEVLYGAGIPASPTEGSGAPVYASAMPPIVPRAAMSPAERLVTKREMESAVSDAARSGTGRGLLAGLLVGGAYEHFKHKRREKRQEKRYQQVTKKLEKARTEYQFATAEQVRKQDTTEAQLRSAERRLVESTQTGFGIPVRPEIAPVHASTPNAARPITSAVAAAERVDRPHSERQPSIDPPERAGVGGKGQRPVEATNEHLEIPKDQRLIKEGAFIAQVEKATGKLVENPSFEYGHEYHRERAQEGMPVMQRNVAAGEVALVAAAMNQAGQQHGGNGGGAGGGGTATVASTSAAPIPNATTQGPVSPRTASTPKPAGADNGRTEQPPLWPWVVALVVIVICLFVLLR